MKRICIIGISGKLGQYMVEHALARGYEVQGVCRPQSVEKLDRFKGRIKIFPGMTDDRAVIQRAVEGCDGVLTVMVPFGVQGYATKTVQAVLDFAEPGARLVFSCGWHISKDGKDRYGRVIWAIENLIAPIARLVRFADLNDQHRAARTVFNSGRSWTMVRGSGLEEGPSEGLPVWAELAHDPILASDKTRRTDFALFMVHALTDDALIHKAPAIVGCNAPSVLAAA